jgi:hypothetical protein
VRHECCNVPRCARRCSVAVKHASQTSCLTTWQRDKPSNKPPAGLLQPLPIPARRWECVLLDLIVELQPTAQGYNAVVVFVDALSKMVHLTHTTTTATAVDIAQQLGPSPSKSVWSVYTGCPCRQIVSRTHSLLVCSGES